MVHKEILDNQRGDGQLTSDQELFNIIQQFPQDELVYAFGYGSGVFSQQLTSASSKTTGGGSAADGGAGMLDLIFVVKDAVKFHDANMNIHPHHYASWIRYAGGGNLANWMQRKFILPDAKVLFHVIYDDGAEARDASSSPRRLPPMKYGVVSWEDLHQDLTQWECLYLAGRLHKPTLPIMKPIPDEFVAAQHTNLQAAISTALLLSTNVDYPSSNKNVIPWSTLYSLIASLSYTGDFRMTMGGVAEDPQKIKKLINAPGQLQRFDDMYRKPSTLLEPFERLGLLTCHDGHGGGGIEWDSSNWSARNEICNYLPTKLWQNPLIGRIHATQADNFDDNILTTIQQDNLTKALTTIVAPAARYQSFKGIFTLGFRKSLQYATAKLSKGLLFRR